MTLTTRPPRPAGAGCTLLLLSLVLHTLFLASAAYSKLSDDFLRRVPDAGADLDIGDGALLAPILVPRVPGSPGARQVQEHFAGWFRRELPQWTLEWHNSTSTTPVSDGAQVPFANLVLRREPPWAGRPGQAAYLTLAAHYDSKYRPEGFVGATDSAVPCAVLMHVARSLDGLLARLYEAGEARGETGGTPDTDMGVQILLLDGEEAFVRWTDTDSLYGARALADKWENSANPAFSNYRDQISQISMFVLLDLLGAANPVVPSYFKTTHWAYRNMASIEGRMRSLGLLETKPEKMLLADSGKLSSQFRKEGIEDDHKPFTARGVPALHLIPFPFPDVWHKMEDDGEHLDMPTVRDWAKIVTAFAFEWLNVMEVETEDGGSNR